MAETSLVDFLLGQSIPSPLLFNHLEHFPTGSMIPSSRPGFVLKAAFYLNICTKGSSARRHGIDGVLQHTILPQPNTQPILSHPNSTLTAPTQSPVPAPASDLGPVPGTSTSTGCFKIRLPRIMHYNQNSYPVSFNTDDISGGNIVIQIGPPIP